MKIFNIIFVLFVFILKLHAQENCTGFEELFRKRHKVANMTHGHPYTALNRYNKLDFPPRYSVGIFLPLQAKLNMSSHKRSFVPQLDELDNTSHSAQKTGIYI